MKPNIKPLFERLVNCMSKTDTVWIKIVQAVSDLELSKAEVKELLLESGFGRGNLLTIQNEATKIMRVAGRGDLIADAIDGNITIRELRAQASKRK